MSTPCLPCVSVNCTFPKNDFDLYSLDGLNFYLPSDPYTVYECPPEYDCDSKPTPWAMRIEVCNKTIVGNIPAGASLAQLNAILAVMVIEALALLENCGYLPPKDWIIRVRVCDTWIVATVPGGSTSTQINNIVSRIQTEYASVLSDCNSVRAPSVDAPTCLSCPGLNCDFPSDLELYSLDGLNFFLGSKLYFVYNCPPDYDCTIRPLAWDLRIVCCGSTIVGNVPGGASLDQINAIFYAMLGECALLTENCPVPQPWEIRIRCCGQWLVATVPVGATSTQINNIWHGLWVQYANLAPTCIAIDPPVPPGGFPVVPSPIFSEMDPTDAGFT